MNRLLLPPLMLLAACATTGAATPQREGPAELGQTTYTGGIRVRPDKIVEDSRCPMNVMCVWAGRLIVKATVTGGNWSKVVDVELGKATHIADGQLTLVRATPQRVAGGTKPAKPEPYRFTFKFDGGF